MVSPQGSIDENHLVWSDELWNRNCSGRLDPCGFGRRRAQLWIEKIARLG